MPVHDSNVSFINEMGTTMTATQNLQQLMEVTNTKQKDLVGLIGSSGVVSEVVRGKRAISKAQAHKLAEHFKVGVETFI